MKYPLLLSFLVCQFSLFAFHGYLISPPRESRLSKLAKIFKLKKKSVPDDFKYSELTQKEKAVVGTINYEKLKRMRRINLTPELNNYKNEVACQNKQ